MSKIIVEKPTQEMLDKLEINTWGTWTCEVSEFDWQYSDKEICYFLEGKVVVEFSEQKVEIGKGDLVTFSKGLSCVWRVLEPVRKVYKFE